MTSKVFVLLPAFNEEVALHKLIPEIAQVLRAENYVFEICIVNDGSIDGTPMLLDKLAPEYPLKVLNHPVNKGYGAALNTGYTWILQNSQADDLIISLDADTTHSPTYFPALLEKIQSGFDVVTASYTMAGGKALGVPPKRRVMSWGANMLFKLFFPVAGGDTYTNGFKVYKASILQKVLSLKGAPIITQTGFPGGTELFLKSIRAGAKVSEIPFILHYENRGGASKLRLTRTIRNYLELLLSFKN